MTGTEIELVCRCGARGQVPFERLGQRVPCPRCGAQVDVTMRLDDLLPPPGAAPAGDPFTRLDNRAAVPDGVALVPVVPVAPEPPARLTGSSSRRRRRASSGARVMARARARTSQQLMPMLWIAVALFAVVFLAARQG